MSNSVKNPNFQKLPKIEEKHFFWWGEQTIYPKNIFLTQFEIVLNFHYFCKVRTCRISVKNSNFQKLPKVVEKHFFWWKEKIILPKNIFLAEFEIVLNIHYFCKPVEFPSKIQFSKNCLKLWRNTSLMRGTNNLSKKYFLHTIWDSTKFSLFCKVRACQIPSKIQISKKCLKLWRNTSFDERNK